MPRAKKPEQKYNFQVLEEVFDQNKLAFLIKNVQAVLEKNPGKITKEKEIEAFKDQLVMAEKYLKRSKNGVVKVKYLQHVNDQGYTEPWYVEHSIGLTPMIRFIRHTICIGLWVDIDMSNAEPTILFYKLKEELEPKKKKKSDSDSDKSSDSEDEDAWENRKLKYLKRYIDNREDVLNKVMAELKLTGPNARTTAKKSILCILNDEKEHDHLMESIYLKNLHKEMSKRFGDILELKKYKKVYPKWLEVTKEKDLKYPDQRFDHPNYTRRFVNAVLVKSKMAEMLQFTWEQFGKPERCVFAFDGLMLEANKGFEDKIDDIEKSLKKKFGVKVELEPKPFKEALNLSSFEIPSYKEPTDALIEHPKHEIKETYGKLDKNGRKEFDPEDPNTYAWVNFRREFAGRSFENEQDMLLEMVPKLRKVFAQIVGAKGCYILKESHENPYERTKKFIDLEGMMWRVAGQRLDFEHFLKEYAKYVPTYAGIVCDPHNTNPDMFNIWRGPRFRLLKTYEINGTTYNLEEKLPVETKRQIVEHMAQKLQRFLDYLESQLCSGEKISFEYLMKYISHIILNPGVRTKVCIVLYSAIQGTGKTTLGDFLMKFIFGPDNSFLLHTLDQACSDFNGFMSGKSLGVISDVGSNKNTWQKDHMKLKSLIDGEKLHINRKGIEAIDEFNYINWLITTNYKNGLHFPDKTDRKFFTPKNSEKNANDKSYWDPFYAEVFNQDFANLFCTWLSLTTAWNCQKESKDSLTSTTITYDWANVNLGRPPMNDLKREMIGVSLKTSDKFFDDLKYSMDGPPEFLSQYLQVEFKHGGVDAKGNELPKVRQKVNFWGYDHEEKSFTGEGLYKAFCDWCRINNEKVQTGTMFGITAKEVPGMKYNTSNRKYYIEGLEYSVGK